jgi:glycosyltransferase involved in cell wall biosynthesis
MLVQPWPELSVTVLTPTCDRAEKLGRLYESLCAQTFRDFEWLVIDDGSVDETPEVMAELVASAPFRVRYLRKENGGRHSAFNLGVREAAGTYCAVIDDDDRYLPQALERLRANWDAIAEPMQFVEVQGLCQTLEGELIGNLYPNDIFDSDYFELTHVLGVEGDRIGMIRTAVLREFPFPEPSNDNYVEPRIVWTRMSSRYRIRCVNEVLAEKEYLPSGITNSMLEQHVKLAGARLMYWEELLAMRRPLPARVRYKAYANLVRTSLHRKSSLWVQARAVPARGWLVAALPAGFILYTRDRHRA